jgi:hypothetical protein
VLHVGVTTGNNAGNIAVSILATDVLQAKRLPLSDQIFCQPLGGTRPESLGFRCTASEATFDLART